MIFSTGHLSPQILLYSFSMQDVGRGPSLEFLTWTALLLQGEYKSLKTLLGKSLARTWFRVGFFFRRLLRMRGGGGGKGRGNRRKGGKNYKAQVEWGEKEEEVEKELKQTVPFD